VFSDIEFKNILNW